MFDPKFFLGIVTDNNDPDKRGRVRVRVMGIHTEITQPIDDVGIGIKEDDLPLAQCMYPVTYTGTKGTCPPPSLLPGDWVFGVSLDGNNYQNLMILGLAKAKFNAESLADGNINAADAYASTTKPTTESGMEKVAEAAKNIVEGKSIAETASTFSTEANRYEDAYSTANKTKSDFNNGESTSSTLVTNNTSSNNISETITNSASPNSFIGSANNGVTTALSPEYSKANITDISNGNTISYNTDAFNTALSTGTAIYNIISYLKNNSSSKFNNFVDSSGLEINTNATPNDIVTDSLSEGYYEYCFNYFNDSVNDKSHILPTFAYNIGVGETEDYIMWYGDPRTPNCSYSRMIQNMRNDGLETEADYLATVIKELNNKYNTNILTIDKNTKNYNYHQYLDSKDILSKSFRDLGTVVIPTLRSTISQSYIVLPEYSNENSYPHEHFGIDFVSTNIPIVSFASGVVEKIYNINPEDNNAVVIKHSCNIKTLYMHMYPLNVKEGDLVKAGQIIGTASGYGENGTNTTTTHLHFEIKIDTNLVDPYDFLVNDLGFYIKKLDTVYLYRNEISDDTELYKKILDNRVYTNTAWSF